MDIATEKLERLDELAPFATILSRRFLRDVGFSWADELHRTSQAVIVGADYSNAEADLNRAFQGLTAADRSVLMKLLSETSLLSDGGRTPDAVAALDDAITYHWPRDFGFESAKAARLEIGDEDADKLDSFAHAKAEAFWKRDEILESLSAEPLCEEDMRIVSAYGFAASDGAILNAVSLFADNETLRAMLRGGALELSAATAGKLQDGLNRRRKEIRADAAPLSVLRWLT